MKIETTRFGEIDIVEERIVEFVVGPYGFEEQMQYTLLADEESPFFWLQSISEPDLAFVVTEPWIFCEDYEFELGDEIKSKLKLKDKENVTVLNMVVIPENKRQTTMNLKSPIIINQENKLAKQIILEEEDYPIKYRIFAEEDASA
ncbi:MAG: flagellar assembly protein FliW [Bacillota bacterium]